jgi:XTP/dITP diphosphohydrolase
MDKEETIAFATSNKNKFFEAKEALNIQKIEIEHFHFEYNEIRSESIEEVARDAVEEAYMRIQRPVFVEDSGLFIPILNGFPGTYSAWVNKKIGSGGILKLLEGINKRNASFETCIAFNNGDEIKIFKGSCAGTISKEIMGKDGFGYDPIFIPEGYRETFAQSIGLKNKLSHRYKALLEFSKYLNRSK